MDENELVKVGMEVALKPVTDIAENALGLLGGDWLSEKRKRTRAKLRKRTEEILRERGAKLDDDPSPSVVAPLLSAAQDESRDELLDLWAKLLAASMDPNRREGYRREFVDVIKRLEPIDALVLPHLENPAPLMPTRRDWVASHLKTNLDLIDLSFRNLVKLELVEFRHGAGMQHMPVATAFGRQLLRLVAD